MVYAQPKISPGEWHTPTPLVFWHPNGSLNHGQTTRPYNNKQQKKRRTCKIVDFPVPVDHRVKLKESEKKDKYLDLARELKKLWNMKVTFILIVIGAIDTVTKYINKGTGGLGNKRTSGDHRNYCIWDRPEYWEESCRLEETCCHSSSSERPSANADLKNSYGLIIINLKNKNGKKNNYEYVKRQTR